MERKPLIGLLSHLEEDKPLFRFEKDVNAVARAGGLPFLLPMTHDVTSIRRACEVFDGFVFLGGPDVSPKMYGEETGLYCGTIDADRDRAEAAFFSEITKNRQKPVLGICRGMQFLNVALGGSLYQDISADLAGSLNHRQDPPYNEPCHRVEIVPESPLFDLLQTDHIHVNSMHHQGVKRLAPGLAVMARAGDGLVEAFYDPGHSFFYGVQWHPEASIDDKNSLAIFRLFIERAGGDE